MLRYLLVLFFSCFITCESRVINFEEAGAAPDDLSNDIAWINGRLMNETLNSLAPGYTQQYFNIFILFSGDIFIVPNKTFLLMGGIRAYNLSSIIFQLGT